MTFPFFTSLFTMLCMAGIIFSQYQGMENPGKLGWKFLTATFLVAGITLNFIHSVEWGCIATATLVTTLFFGAWLRRAPAFFPEDEC